MTLGHYQTLPLHQQVACEYSTHAMRDIARNAQTHVKLLQRYATTAEDRRMIGTLIKLTEACDAVVAAQGEETN